MVSAFLGSDGVNITVIFNKVTIVVKKVTAPFAVSEILKEL